MAKSTPSAATPLRQQLERLAAFEGTSVPVLSLYLNLAPDQNGRENFDPFVRKSLGERIDAFKLDSPERLSLERDRDRILTYLSQEVNRSANGLALFAAAGADDFFEAVQLDAPLPEHLLVVGSVPHLYPLARLADQHPRYAAVTLDTTRARIVVFSLGGVESAENVTGEKTRRTQVGGWSQARYQRRVDNARAHNVKEMAEALERIVTQEQIQHIVVVGDAAVAVPLLREQLSPALQSKLVDVLPPAKGADDSELLARTLEALRHKDAVTDAEQVAQLLDAWQSHGLGVVGPEATLSAFEKGQVDELLVTADPHALKPTQHLPADAAPGPVVATSSSPNGAPDEQRTRLAGELVTRAEQTGARIRFIEDPALLADVGGVGAFLRFRI